MFIIFQNIHLCLVQQRSTQSSPAEAGESRNLITSKTRHMLLPVPFFLQSMIVLKHQLLIEGILNHLDFFMSSEEIVISQVGNI